MDLKDIRMLARQGEGLRIEFKRKLNHPEKVVREIVALANTKGGFLLLGVDDNGLIPGLTYPEEDNFELKTAISKLCKPTIRFKEHLIPVDAKKSIICYEIFESTRKPHYAKESPSQQYGKAYFRVADKSIQASKELRQILKRGNSKKDFKLIYGETEQKLMAFIGGTELGATLEQCVVHTQLKKYFISKSLVKMVLANVLKIIPSEKGDLFTAVEY